MSPGAVSTTSPNRDKTANRGLAMPVAGAIAAVLLIIVGVVLAWRRDETLPTIYGKRRGGEATRSVNGTAVLADLFRKAGFRVTTMTRFSPRLNKYHVIVWFPDDFEPPDKDHREFLESWLKESGNTLVYVGRDYDAAMDYWNHIARDAPPEYQQEILRRQSEARADWEAQRSRMPTNEYARWFTVRRDEKARRAEELSGPWTEGIDAKQVNLHLEGRLALPDYGDAHTLDDSEPPDGIDTLLASAGEALVFRLTNDVDDEDENWVGGQIIVVNNGSFLLNYPLVNHEHRKLAAKLIEECGEAGDKVVFVESEAGGPKIVEKEPTGNMPTALELLKVWPLNAILLHVAVLGLVLCLARSPIFGRPRELAVDSPSDFGKHVAALGKLLAQTKDRNYAHARLMQYRQIAERRMKRNKK